MEDFHLLERITLSGSAEKVKAKVKQMGMKPKQYVCIFLPYHDRKTCMFPPV